MVKKKLKIINLKAQSWSIDIILGFVIFIVATVIFYSILNTNTELKVEKSKKEALMAIQYITSDNKLVGIVDGDKLSEIKLERLNLLSYGDLKKGLGTEGDVCIYLEDEKGNVIPIKGSKMGIGTPNIIIDDKSCG